MQPAEWFNTRRALPGLLAALCALAGCYAPSAVVHAQLDIAASGAFTLDGQAVAPEALAPKLQSLVATRQLAIMDIHASPQVPMAVIHQATEAAKQARIRVSFADGPQTP